MKINEGFLAQMREATQLLQSEGPMAATAAIQRALHGATTPDGASAQPDWSHFLPQQPELQDINSLPASGADMLARLRTLAQGKWTGAALREAIEDVDVHEVVDTGDDAGMKGRFLSGSCTNRAGTRAYKLYIPSGYSGEALPLIVMLHGCTQNPDDFAAGTGMNAVAEENNCFVVYPAQTKSANGSNCWNWFQPGDQRRDKGEPSIIADITREIIRTYKIDTSRIYVAGLSAGGAMAVVMGASYPELYAAVGIHSGLPYAVAHDVPSALAAMKSRRAKAATRNVGIGAKAPAPLGHPLPVIVFHGDRDTTVHPGNGDQVLAQCVPSAGFMPAEGKDGAAKVEKGKIPNGRGYTKIIHNDAHGKALAEKWIVHGAGHAWSGGSSKGSYTDPKGPDAAREMLRFFYTHRLNAS
ncbi:MAG TPA: PHB depolymerase family esterase [Noviherbaspirillum sp.]|nr:PHB depolymerase family esterase [Noviherbaspirillum sp.]